MIPGSETVAQNAPWPDFTRPAEHEYYYPTTITTGILTMPAQTTQKIHTDLIALRKKIGNLEAKQRQGVMYKVKSWEELEEKLRLAADELEMPMAGSPVSQKHHYYEPIVGVDKNGKPQTMLIHHCESTIRFMSSDGSYVDFVGSGHGSGTDDKSGGKASTYAQKDGVLKGLRIPNNIIPDTDDAGKLPVKEKRAATSAAKMTIPAVSFETVMDTIKNSKTKTELEEAKLLAKTATLKGDERNLLQAAFVEANKRVY